MVAGEAVAERWVVVVQVAHEVLERSAGSAGGAEATAGGTDAFGFGVPVGTVSSVNWGVGVLVRTSARPAPTTRAVC